MYVTSTLTDRYIDRSVMTHGATIYYQRPAAIVTAYRSDSLVLRPLHYVFYFYLIQTVPGSLLYRISAGACRLQ